MTDHEPDLELLTRLRAADPASSLLPTDPDRVAALLAATMSESRSDTPGRTAWPGGPTPESRATGTRDRSPLTWLVAAAAVVLIAGAGAIGLAQRGHDSSSPTARGSVTRLGYASTPGRCITPRPADLRKEPVAFAARLVSLVDDTATFDVTRWYAGGPTPTVQVSASTSRVAELVRAVDLRVGRDYLVAASDGNLTGCGFSGPATPQLQKLYDRAFG